MGEIYLSSCLSARHATPSPSTSVCLSGFEAGKTHTKLISVSEVGQEENGLAARVGGGMQEDEGDGLPISCQKEVG